ncbi:hypothetical protein [Chitinimonas koreensis]|uniref:hypothetical protein n=1 Tax=Chitinimonas koreensis TaxID=356302 RepID=UPI0012FAC419|nr:hypothetical protein [Chitinimonas koreensis]QNM97615.1 hypothetical protein H9L41_04765 [Chitinimonas koreensis]
MRFSGYGIKGINPKEKRPDFPSHALEISGRENIDEPMQTRRRTNIQPPVHCIDRIQSDKQSAAADIGKGIGVAGGNAGQPDCHRPGRPAPAVRGS